jgi:hypothetical protein
MTAHYLSECLGVGGIVVRRCLFAAWLLFGALKIKWRIFYFCFD